MVKLIFEGNAAVHPVNAGKRHIFYQRFKLEQRDTHHQHFTRFYTNNPILNLVTLQGLQWADVISVINDAYLIMRLYLDFDGIMQPEIHSGYRKRRRTWYH